MRGLAKFVSAALLVIGALAGLVLLVAGFAAMEGYGGQAAGWLLIGWGAAAFLSAATSSCILSLLASIDQRLENSGMAVKDEAPETSDMRRERLSKAKAEIAAATPDAHRSDVDPDLDSKLEFERTRGRS